MKSHRRPCMQVVVGLGARACVDGRTEEASHLHGANSCCTSASTSAACLHNALSRVHTQHRTWAFRQSASPCAGCAVRRNSRRMLRMRAANSPSCSRR